MSYLVECDWASSSIYIAVNHQPFGFMLYEEPKHMNKGVFGFCEHGSLMLTKEEAKKLAMKLLVAVEQYEDIDKNLDSLEPEA